MPYFSPSSSPTMRSMATVKRIVSECQAYLDRYEREGRPRFAVDIDRIVGLLEGKK